MYSFSCSAGPRAPKRAGPLSNGWKRWGCANEFLSTFVWEELDMAMAPQDLMDRISAPIEEFFRTRTKKEVLDAAMARNISICPLFSMEDELKDPNLAARAYWAQIEHPELKCRQYPIPDNL